MRLSAIRRKHSPVPRVRAVAHLKEIARTAEAAAEFIKGHRLTPAYRRQLYRELRDAQIAIRHIFEDATGQERSEKRAT